jgi:hypothetical protein
MERRLSPQNVSTIVACGGTGKSQLLSLDAVSIATGRPLSGFEVDEPRRVWMHNTEDDITEMRRKIAAIQQHFRIDGREIHDQIFLSSARSTKFTIVEENQNGALLQAQTCDQIIKFIRKHKIAVWMIDPFVRVHAVDENKNKHMDAVMEALLTIMLHTDCAILVSHHTNKSVFNADDLNMGLSRGASAVTDASRFSHVLRNMTEKETKRFHDVSLDDRHAYVRLERVKSNLFFSPDHTDWFKRVSITLENGDEVGILDPVCLSLAQEEEDHCRFILERHATRNVEADFGPLFQACLNDENLPDDLAELKPLALKERLRRWIKKQPDWQFTQTKNRVCSKYVWKSQ